MQPVAACRVAHSASQSLVSLLSWPQVHTVGVGVAIGQSCMLLSAGEKVRPLTLLPGLANGLCKGRLMCRSSSKLRGGDMLVTCSAALCTLSLTLLANISPCPCRASASRWSTRPPCLCTLLIFTCQLILKPRKTCPLQGKRFMLEHATAMLHQPRVPPTGQRQAIEIQIKWREVRCAGCFAVDLLLPCSKVRPATGV